MIPSNLKYATSHEWAQTGTDGTVTVGITFHAQEQLGDVVFIQAPEAGRMVRQGEACALIESVKAASDIHAPVSGEILGSNPQLAEEPELINAKPYETWIFRIKPANPAELDTLLDPAAYRKVAES